MEIPTSHPIELLEHDIASLERVQRGDLYWKNPDYANTRTGKKAIELGIALTLHPEYVDRLIHVEQGSTAARVLYIPWHDKGGDCYIGVKGVRFEANYENPEVRTHYKWEANDRRSGYNDIAGREILDQAYPEVISWRRLLRKNPYLVIDVQAPLWQPVSVIHTGEVVITQEVDDQGHQRFIPDYGVVTQRRFPYTYNRIDEFVEHTLLPQSSINGLDLLRRKWGYETNQHVYFRAANRLGEAFKLFWNSQLTHNQIFKVTYDPNKKVSAWINFNNIAIDGSIGDFDDSKVMEKLSDCWQHHHETIGSMILYLSFIARVQPELLESSDFVRTFFNQWRIGVGKDYWKFLVGWNIPASEYFPEGNALDQVVHSIHNTLQVYSTVDTRPSSSNVYNPSGYLSHHAKNIWIPSLEKAINTVEKFRPLLEL